MADEIKKEDQIEKGDLENIFDTMGNLVPGMENGVDSIAAVLALEGKEFRIMSNIILNEVEKGLNNVEDRLILVQGMNASGQKAEDLVQYFEVLSEQLDEQMTEMNMPQNKIDFLKQLIGMVINAVVATDGIPSRIIQIPIELCREDAKIPTYANTGDAGMDIYMPTQDNGVKEIMINPGETFIIKTGFKTAIPLGYELQVRPRSGQSVKTKLRVANSPGTIDANYRDEIGVIIENIEPKIADIDAEYVAEDGKTPYMRVNSILYGKPFVLSVGDRFAQLVLKENPTALFYEVENVGEIGQDRAGGFGSTGIK